MSGVNGQTVLNRFGTVVFACKQLAAAGVTDVFRFRRHVFDVVAGVALPAQAAARKPFDDFFVGNNEIDDGVDFKESLQGVGLSDSAGKSV